MNPVAFCFPARRLGGARRPLLRPQTLAGDTVYGAVTAIGTNGTGWCMPNALSDASMAPPKTPMPTNTAVLPIRRL